MTAAWFTTVPEAAAKLGVPERTLRFRIYLYHHPALRLGANVIRVPRWLVNGESPPWMDDPPPAIVTSTWLRARLGISEPTFYRAVRRGEIPMVRGRGPHWHMSRRRLHEWLGESLHEGSTEEVR